MRKLILVAAMLMASASAQAGNSFGFNIEGHKIRISIPKSCSSLSCISVSAPTITEKFKDLDTTDAAPASAAPAATPATAAVPAATPSVAPATPTAAPKVTVLPPPPVETYSTTPQAVSTPSLSAEPAASTTPAPVQTAPVVVASAPAQTPVVSAPAAVETASSPVGMWMSEKKEGKIRIEDCNGNLCGYAVDARTGANGAKVLVNMKPRGDKWAGRINDTRSGGTYDSTIALRGADKLKVQGCALGGMFCGGETWTRIQ